MITFESVYIDKENKGRSKNAEYLPFILSNFFKYKDMLIDDYFPKNNMDLIDFIIAEINQFFPWFLICKYHDEPLGCIWINHWHGSYEKLHSCQIHAFVDKKFWGKPHHEAMNLIFDYLFNVKNIERIQMEVPEHNKLALLFAEKQGFQQDGIIRNATFKDKKPINNILYSLLKEEFNHG